MLPKDTNSAPDDSEIIAANTLNTSDNAAITSGDASITPITPITPITAAPLYSRERDVSGNESGNEAVAESYVHSQVQKARKSLRVTQILSTAMVLGTLLYLGYITSTVRDSLQPVAAAEIADGLISEKVNEQAQNLAQQTREKVPQLIAGLPDYAIKEMPGLRANLEQQIETDMRRHFASASQGMEGHVDEFLTANKSSIAEFLKTGQNPEATRHMGQALEAEFYKFLKEVPIGSDKQTAHQKLDQTLSSLQQIEKKITRLAINKNLTPVEKKLRRAIAIMSGNIDRHVKDNGLTISKLPG